jgi:hypothetical protein
MAVGLYSGTSGLALGTGLYKDVSGLWGGASGLINGFGGSNPFSGASLYLNFLAGAPLDSRVTFSRGSNATLVDSTGKITYAPANLLLQSQTFDNASWTKNAATVTANSTVAPDGTTTADTITESATNDLHVAFQTNTLSALTTHIMSVYVQAGTRSFAMLRVGGGGFTTGPAIKASLTGAGTTTTLEGPVVSSAITAVGSGWYRVSMTFVSTATTAGYTPQVGPHNNGSAVTYLGDGSTVFLWGAQLEPVTYQTTPSTYVATTSAAYYGPRFDYDPVTLAAKGLLIEEARTNLLLRSEEFDNATWIKSNSTVTANATTSPDGTVDAEKLVENTANAQHFVLQIPSATASTAYTFTVYLKAAERTRAALIDSGGSSATGVFDLSSGAVVSTSNCTASVSNSGNGWYRCSITFTSAVGQTGVNARVFLVNTGTNTTYTGDGTSGVFLYGAQLEAGAFATSYIPTVASQVTRSADVAAMTGTNYSSWYNTAEGTLFAEFTLLPRTLSGTAVIAYNGSANGRWSYLSSASARMLDGTNTAVAGSIGTPTAVNKTASALSSAGMAISLNGAAPGTSAYVGTFGSQNELNIGQQSGASSINGHIRQIAYYNTRLTNTTLQAITA